MISASGFQAVRPVVQESWPMPCVRLSATISLMLVATTLPVSARSVPVPADKPAPQPLAPAPLGDNLPGPAPADPAGSTRHKPLPVLQIAPNTEVCDTGFARTPCSPFGSALLDAWLEHGPGSVLAPSQGHEPGPTDMARPHERSRRSWLVCRYAHAPPCPAQGIQ